MFKMKFYEVILEVPGYGSSIDFCIPARTKGGAYRKAAKNWRTKQFFKENTTIDGYAEMRIHLLRGKIGVKNSKVIKV